MKQSIDNQETFNIRIAFNQEQETKYNALYEKYVKYTILERMRINRRLATPEIHKNQNDMMQLAHRLNYLFAVACRSKDCQKHLHLLLLACEHIYHKIAEYMFIDAHIEVRRLINKIEGALFFINSQRD